MAAEIFKGGNLRLILDTETDADSPITETLKNAIRYYSENILILGWSTGVTGTVDSVVTDTMTDAALGADADEHNGRTLVMTSGSAKGNAYTIDDTTATTLVCTGDDLAADGVAAADDYEVFFDLLTNTDGHDHDNINSASVVLADAQVTQAKLKTSTGSVSNAGGGANLTLPGGEYGFCQQEYITPFTGTQNLSAQIASALAIGSYTTNIYLISNTGGATAYARQRYVTASGETHWIFLLKDKATGETIASYQSPDHPCFGNGNRPLLVPHPFPDYDKSKHEIVVINPSSEMIEDAIARTIPIVGGGYLTADSLKANKYKVDGTRSPRDILEVFETDFEIDEIKNADWPDIPITVGLPTVMNGKIMNNYLYKEGETVTPIRVTIKKPDYITPLGMRLKNVK